MWVHNGSDRYAGIFPVTMPGAQFPPNSTTELPLFKQLPGSPPGAFIYVSADAAPAVEFSIRVRDLSQNAASAGVEIPVVRQSQFLERTFSLLNVPVRGDRRTLLRVYGAADAADRDVVVRVYEPVFWKIVSESYVRVRNIGFVDYIPAYGELDLASLAVGPLDHARVEIEPAPGTRVWAFVSVTDNRTQNVTVITPSR